MSDLRSNGAEALTGYMHPAYAESLAEFGRPRRLPRCGGWILERRIPGFPFRDAMGCYPLFFCRDWSQLTADLEEVGTELVSLSLVTDPFGEYDPTYLCQCFRDVVIPFKEHYVIDLSLPINEIGSRHRRKHARRALREVQVDVCLQPAQLLEEWLSWYVVLTKRHGISGLRAFSRRSFTKQLSIPGMIMLRALYEDAAIGAQLYFVQGAVVHCHLGAFSEVGYELGVSNALDGFSIQYFRDKARWLDLGGGAGLASDGTDGLSQYKRQWSTDTRMTYFCGRIIDRKRYSEMTEAKGVSGTDYFPAYRQGEFG